MIYNCCCLVFCKFSLRMLRLRCQRLCQQRRLVRRCVWGNNNNNHFSKQKQRASHSFSLSATACLLARPSLCLCHCFSLCLCRCPLCILLLFRNGDDAICVCFSVILHSEQCTVKGEDVNRGVQEDLSFAARVAPLPIVRNVLPPCIIHTCCHLRALAAAAAGRPCGKLTA